MPETIVLLPSNICHDVFFLLKHIGATIKFIDIDRKEFEINKEIVLKNIMINSQTMLLWNHSYGNPHVPYDFFIDVKKKKSDTIIIDDRCLCNPAYHASNINDSYIDLIIYSTGLRKQVDLKFGAWGLINSKYDIPKNLYDFDPDLHNKLKVLLFNNLQNDFFVYVKHAWIELDLENYSHDTYHVDILKENNRWIHHKKELSEIYYQELDKAYFVHERFNEWRVNILVKNKLDIIKHLFQNDLFASNHYLSIGSIVSKKKFPVAEWLHKHILNLFIDKHYTKEMAYKTSDIINKYGYPI